MNEFQTFHGFARSEKEKKNLNFLKGFFAYSLVKQNLRLDSFK